MTENTSDEYSKFEQIKVCGDTAADYLRDHDIEPTTKAMLDRLAAITDVVQVGVDYVSYLGGLEGGRIVTDYTDLDLALADLLTWELYLGEK